MITYSIFTKFFVADVAVSGIIAKRFIVLDNYHPFVELQLLINLFDVLFKRVYTYLFRFLHKRNRVLRKGCIIKTLNVVVKSDRGVFLIVIG